MVATVNSLHFSGNEKPIVYNDGPLPNIGRERCVRIASSFPNIIYCGGMGRSTHID